MGIKDKIQLSPFDQYKTTFMALLLEITNEKNFCFKGSSLLTTRAGETVWVLPGLALTRQGTRNHKWCGKGETPVNGNPSPLGFLV